ncbi:uncharacterized protein LOC122231889 isoform X2 [Panthera tigris]|uniref:uncharacterized protein LOC122231889 isoform X2 n=1 Tax=Panthera tigris TaxID=9694 RepID=UPI001C6FB650|nr:uncharacterized protein LOC122231889 isoform X2 [Panthera tigris]
MSNSLKWRLKVKLEDLEIPHVSLAIKIMMATLPFSSGAEPTRQSTKEEVETTDYIAFFKKTWPLTEKAGWSLPALPPRDREAACAAPAWRDYSPQKAPRRGWGEESRPGARPSGASGRARASWRWRKRRATARPVTSSPTSLSFPASTPLAGAGRSHFSPHTLDKTSFLFFLGF